MELFSKIFEKFADVVLSLLPTSPFQPYLATLSDIPYLGFLNWFVPIGACVKIAMAWLGCITLFYVYSVLLRWLKIIGD